MPLLYYKIAEFHSENKTMVLSVHSGLLLFQDILWIDRQALNGSKQGLFVNGNSYSIPVPNRSVSPKMLRM